jgi:ADP-heptose:LPS heptosyltransferase
MHIADALNVPLIVLFGSTLASKNGPYMNKKARLVQSLLSCAPCQNTPNFHICETYQCMADISPGDVMGELFRLIDNLEYDYI